MREPSALRPPPPPPPSDPPDEDLTDDQLDGLACVRCERRFAIGMGSTVVRQGPRGLLFRCFPRCAPPESGRGDAAARRPDTPAAVLPELEQWAALVDQRMDRR